MLFSFDQDKFWSIKVSNNLKCQGSSELFIQSGITANDYAAQLGEKGNDIQTCQRY
jgi:hypothetical protein